jgi:hypothetical protein
MTQSEGCILWVSYIQWHEKMGTASTIDEKVIVIYRFIIVFLKIKV